MTLNLSTSRLSATRFVRDMSSKRVPTVAVNGTPAYDTVLLSNEKTRWWCFPVRIGTTSCRGTCSWVGVRFSSTPPPLCASVQSALLILRDARHVQVPPAPVHPTLRPSHKSDIFSQLINYSWGFCWLIATFFFRDLWSGFSTAN